MFKPAKYPNYQEAVSITYLRSNTVSTMICNLPKTNYFFRDYSDCPVPTDLENTLEDVFTDDEV
jgi:hypothetical protein